ncbi:MAG: asparagine synthase (glutamine-hydrolyzing) [Terriglobales bacterium]
MSLNQASAGLPVEAWLQSMLNSLRHRGPDDRGSFHRVLPDGAGAVGLANTRLAILDLTSAGHQPMCDPETGNWIVLNGEIYNHLEIRKELGAPNGGWQSGSDTETVLRAYARWGSDCVHKLRGMFAVAIFDARRKTIWCARDRLGIKPLYYWAGPPGVVFASEVRGLLSCGLFEPQCDRVGLAHFVRFGSVSDPHTLLEGVQSLAAGACMEIAAGQIVAMRRYWEPDGCGTPAEQRNLNSAIRDHLRRAVGEHMLSDVPVASLLSGGIDSSVVTALAAQFSPRPIRTFTVFFRGTPEDESQFARAIAARYKTDHHEVTLSPEEVLEQVPAAVAAMDLPSADGINTYVVARAVAGTGSKVILSGLGGDEVFGGYRSFRLLPMAYRWSGLLQMAPKLLLAMAPGGSRLVEMTRSDTSLMERYLSLRSFWGMEELQRMGVAVQAWNTDGSERKDGAPVAVEISRLELGQYMRNVLLRDADVMSMAHSVELRVPFLDHRLVEYCLGTGAARAHKRLLVQATAELLPRDNYQRRKRGFELPMDSWMRGPLSGFVHEGVVKLQDSRLLPRVDLPEVERRFRAGQLGWSRLWQMAVLGQWADRHNLKANIGTSDAG